MTCLLLLICSKQVICYSQNIDYVWPLGYDCCQYPGFGTVNMDFTSGSVIYTTVQRHQNINITNGSACNSTGNLLFSSNGIYVANFLDDTMQNGSGLNPSYFTNQHVGAGLTLIQSNLVIPSLTDSSQYILFHNTIDDYFVTGASLHLYYSIIDMSRNGGLGEVLNKNTVLLNDSMVPGRITATRHANGRDWWIIVHKLYSNNAIEFLYTPHGFQGPFYKSLNIVRDFFSGYMLFNPQGNKFAMYDKFLGVEVAGFDRCSGEFTNSQVFNLPDTAEDLGFGLAFSTNGNYLYISSIINLYQYDLSSPNLDSSRQTVGVYDNFNDTVTTNNPTAFLLMALAPDGKIYMSCGNSSPSLHVINSPDSAGMACDFQQHTILLPVVNAFTMPNFPNYRLGREIGSVCDSLTNDISKINIDNILSVYPNPANQRVIIRCELKFQAELQIYNQLGKEVFLTTLSNGKNEIAIDVSAFSDGIYFCRLKGKENSEVLKFSVLR